MITVLVTIALIVGSAFFVMAEFSLMAARRHRLEEAARRSRSGRAALRNAGDLTLMLAGAQLGITICTLALGAFTKPAVHHALTPWVERLGLAPQIASGASFVLALALVTFLHLVVGEMAPKSLSLAHPERVAVGLALPMQGFLWLTRPVLQALNRSANWMVRRTGAEPVDELDPVPDADSLRQLVEHSASVGALAAHYRQGVVEALDLTTTTVGDVVIPDDQVATVPVEATVADVQAATIASGHLRIPVLAGDRVTGVVHVRDTLDADPNQDLDAFMRRILVLDARTSVYEALARMQQSRTHLAVVTRGGIREGIVTLQDVLPRVLPRDRAR